MSWMAALPAMMQFAQQTQGISNQAASALAGRDGRITGSTGGDIGLGIGLMHVAPQQGLSVLMNLLNGGGDEDQARILHTNPAIGVIANLFGMGARPTSTGGIEISKDLTRNGQFRFAQPLNWNLLGQYLQAPAGPLDANAVNLANMAMTNVPGIMADLSDLAASGTRTAIAASDTGLPVDVSGAYDVGRSRLLNDLIPATLAAGGRFALSDTTTRDRAMALAARTAEAQALSEIEAMENAMGRRMTGVSQLLPAAAGLRTSTAAFPLGVASDMQSIAAANRAAQPGSRMLEFLLGASGTPFPTITQGARMPTSVASGAAMSQLPSAMAALANVFGNQGQSGGGGSTGAGVGSGGFDIDEYMRRTYPAVSAAGNAGGGSVNQSGFTFPFTM